MAEVKFSALANTTVIVTAIVYGFLLRVAGLAGFLGIWLWIVLMLSLWRYGHAVLRNVATGWTKFPPPDVESTNPFTEFGIAFHSAFFVLLLFLLASTPFIGGALRWVLLAAVLGVFPASAAVMAMTRNLGAAFNPLSIASLVRDLGADYAKLLGVSVLLGVFLVLANWVAETVWFLGLLGDMAAVWTVLALFLATGAALRAHRYEFDLVEALDDAEERELKRKQEDWQKTLDIAYTSVRSGLAPQAYRTVKELIASEGDSLEIYQWTFNGMLAWDEPQHAAMLGERFAKRLWDEGRKIDALDLAQRCRKLSPSFQPPAAFTTELAAYARELGRHRLADDLGELASASRPATN